MRLFLGGLKKVIDSLGGEVKSFIGSSNLRHGDMFVLNHGTGIVIGLAGSDVIQR